MLELVVVNSFLNIFTYTVNQLNLTAVKLAF